MRFELQNDLFRLPGRGRALADGQLLPDEEHDGFYYALLQKT